MTDHSTFTIAVAQMRVAAEPAENQHQMAAYAAQAAARSARLLVLPEGIIARDPQDNGLTARMAEPLDGPFVTAMRDLSREHEIALAATVHVPLGEGRVANVFVIADHGELTCQYHKLHPYDAFTDRESERVTPGRDVPDVVEIDGFRFGVMTCYDVRFPEMARSAAVRGADALLVPAAWVRGSLKEMHWDVMTTARALENTCYVVACGEISAKNIGCSKVIDPLGVVVAGAAEQPTLFFATLERGRIDQARAALPVLANRRFADPVLTSDA